MRKAPLEMSRAFYYEIVSFIAGFRGSIVSNLSIHPPTEIRNDVFAIKK